MEFLGHVVLPSTYKKLKLADVYLCSVFIPVLSKSIIIIGQVRFTQVHMYMHNMDHLFFVLK